MPPRAHSRIPFQLRVKYRSKSSFLVAYSVNISRGGLFLETTADTSIGDIVSLMLEVPGEPPCEVPGRVAWRREIPDDTGPIGVGVEFTDPPADLGALIDRLIDDMTRTSEHMKVLLVTPDPDRASAIVRTVKSTITTAEILVASNAKDATKMLKAGTELAVIDGTRDPTTPLSIVSKIAQARVKPPLPTVFLTSDSSLGQRAAALGATEIVPTDAPVLLSRALIRALGRPSVEG